MDLVEILNRAGTVELLAGDELHELLAGDELHELLGRAARPGTSPATWWASRTAEHVAGDLVGTGGSEPNHFHDCDGSEPHLANGPADGKIPGDVPLPVTRLDHQFTERQQCPRKSGSADRRG